MWHTLGFRTDPSNTSTIQYAPYGEQDFISLGADVVFNVQPVSQGVVIDASRGLYLLTGHPRFPDTWRVIHLHHW